jgi:AraC-like DNA-binding protein
MPDQHSSHDKASIGWLLRTGHYPGSGMMTESVSVSAMAIMRQLRIWLFHQKSHAWSLEQLAKRAGMSRARFAAYFRQVVGMTPFDYLTNWRLGVAQTMLRKGNSLIRIVSF